MITYDYTWKIGFEFSSNRKLQTDRPVTEETILIDLYNGHRHRTQATCPAKPTDRDWPFLPDTVMHTWVIGSLSEDALRKLREMAKYVPDEFCNPFKDVVFEPAA
jgi:hypothetical protein